MTIVVVVSIVEGNCLTNNLRTCTLGAERQLGHCRVVFLPLCTRFFYESLH